MTRDHDPYYVEALGRGLIILDCFVDGPAHLSLAELSARVPFNRGTTFRLLRTLEQCGYLRQDPNTKRYHLTFKVLDLQRAALEALDIPSQALPLLERLNERLHESVSVAVLDGAEIRYIARVPARRIMSINLGVGSKLPAHATSLGKALLAGLDPAAIDEIYPESHLPAFTEKTTTDRAALHNALDEVRRRGFAISDEELEVGLRSAAAPIRDRHGDIVAAANISASTAIVSIDRLRDEFVPLLIETANQISENLGYRLVPAGD